MATPRRPVLLALLLRLLCCNVAAEREVLVKEVVLDSAVADIVYTGKAHECVLLTTKNKRLYFSEDSGQSWKEVTGSIEKASATLQIERIIVNPADKTVVILQTQRRMRDSGEGTSRFYPYIYISEDAGRNWRRAWGKHHGLHNWISHPTEREWALVSWWSGDCNADKVKVIDKGSDEEEAKDDEKSPCVHRLMFTKDLGKNFLAISDYVVQFSWGTSAHTQENRIYFSSYKKKSGDQGKLTLWTSEEQSRQLVRPSDVAEDASEADVVVLSTWFNDFKQQYCDYKCYNGTVLEPAEIAPVTVANLLRLIRAVHAENPAAFVLVMALYPDASRSLVVEDTLDTIAAINAQVKEGLRAEPNVAFVDFDLAPGQDMFQVKPPGHPNCRGDRIMATQVMRTLFDRGVLGRSLALPEGDLARECLRAESCGAIVEKACCQAAASCRVDPDGVCVAYSAGEGSL